MFVKIPVTVIIPVKDEADNLPRCLAALGRYDEVVVVDSGSTDGTVDIARAAGAQVVDFTWNGKYPKKRNWYLINHDIRNEWVLFLDADEVVNPPFDAEVERAIRREGAVGYWITFTNYFIGRQLRHGVAQRKLALFRPASGRYERIEDDHWSSLDMEVHEHPILSGPIDGIASRVDHCDMRGLGKFLRQHVEYARWEARRHADIAGGKVDVGHFTRRQRFKYRNLDRWWFGYFYFFLSYVVKGGFLDGRAGFAYAAYKLWYFETIFLMIQERARIGRSL